jgi:hypothetical protein
MRTSRTDTWKVVMLCLKGRSDLHIIQTGLQPGGRGEAASCNRFNGLLCEMVNHLCQRELPDLSGGETVETVLIA